MKRHQLPALLALTASNRYGGQLAYALARMRLRLGKYVDEIATRRKEENCFTGDVVKYLKRRREIVMEHAARNDAGAPSIDEHGNVKLADVKAFDAAAKAFEEANPDQVVALKIQEKALADWLNEEIAIEPWAGKADWLPKDGTAEEFEAILLLVAIPDEAQEPAK